MTRACPRCQTENRETAQFCKSCRAALGPATATPVRYCPSGRHPMDPGWTVCPYCNVASQGRAAAAPAGTPASVPASGRQPTMTEAAAAPAAAKTPPPDAAPRPAAEVPLPVGESRSAPSAERRRATVFAPAPAGGAATAPPRRLAGFLVTYTWKVEGEAFPLYEGRNFVGSAPDCDVSLAADPQMSGRHAAILASGGKFWIDDAMSLNGTYVGGKRIDEKHRLANYDSLRTGTTVWRFVAAEAPSTTSGTGSPAQEVA